MKGDGATVKTGDRVTFEFIASIPGGKELANTMKRGLPYTLIADSKGDALAAALVGMRETGEREATLTFEAPGIPGVVPADQPIVVWIKIDSLNAKSSD